MNVESHHKFKGSAEELRLALIKDVKHRLETIPDYGDTRAEKGRRTGEQDALDSFLHMLENLHIEEAQA